MVTSDRIKVTEIAGVDVYRLADVHSVVFQAALLLWLLTRSSFLRPVMWAATKHSAPFW